MSQDQTADHIAAAIAADSDQLNADDFVGGPVGGYVTRVVTRQRRQKGDQPVDIYLHGYAVPWRPCKTMLRLLTQCWGRPERASDWVGRGVVVYRDPDVTFGGRRVGGIRVSHLTGLDAEQELSLTETRGRKRQWRVGPMPSLDLAQVLADHEATVEQLDEARAAAGRGPVADLTDAQRRILAARYLDEQRLLADLGGDNG